MPEQKKPPNAIPGSAFPTAPTQEERAKQGTPPKARRSPRGPFGCSLQLQFATR
jgi:hypothetical protein